MAGDDSVAADGKVGIGAVMDRDEVTRHHLARQFSAQVSTTVKQFARVKRAEAARTRAVAARAAYERNVPWSTIAHQVGYYDQAHLIRDFKALTGSTPGQCFFFKQKTAYEM